MTQRKHSPAHDRWHKIVEGQIRHTMGRHPEWFTFKDAREKQNCVNSLAKRIVGEIVAWPQLAMVPERDVVTMSRQVEGGNVREVFSPARSMVVVCASGASFQPMMTEAQRRALGYQ